jgi:hypothetical protein
VDSPLESWGKADIPPVENHTAQLVHRSATAYRREYLVLFLRRKPQALSDLVPQGFEKMFEKGQHSEKLELFTFERWEGPRGGMGALAQMNRSDHLVNFLPSPETIARLILSDAERSANSGNEVLLSGSSRWLPVHWRYQPAILLIPTSLCRQLVKVQAALLNPSRQDSVEHCRFRLCTTALDVLLSSLGHTAASVA